MDHKFYAAFDLYGPAGVRVRFSVAADEQAEHLGQLDAYLGSLMGGGYSVEPAGVEAGEEVETIGGWVLGETSKDEHCLYLYAANPGLQFRVTTVFIEKMGEMPFNIPKGAKVWPGQAPTREVAEKKGFFHTCPDFKIVNKPTGKTTDAGKAITKYDRVYGVTAPPAPQPTNGNGSKPRPEMPPEVRFQSPPPEAENPFDIAHEVTPPIGRWTKRTAKAAINSGAAIDFAGPEDATDFGVAAGAYADKPASVAAYESVKAGVKQPTKEKVMAAWVDYVAGVLMDGEMWGKGEEG